MTKLFTLFLIIGFEVLALALDGRTVIAAVLAIPLVLAARFVSVATPMGRCGCASSLPPAPCGC